MCQHWIQDLCPDKEKPTGIKGTLLILVDELAQQHGYQSLEGKAE
jgi:hypothetical protein